jgi:hypothetical protein
MSDWIRVAERLPEENTKVLICLCGGEIHTATIRKGITEQEREQMKKGLLPDPLEPVYNSLDGTRLAKRSSLYGGADVFGNNLVPYRWDGDGPMSWFGQEVTHWQLMPQLPDN